MLVPFAVTANQLESDQSLAEFEKLCSARKDSSIRSTNCKLANMQRKGMAIIKAHNVK